MGKRRGGRWLLLGVVLLSAGCTGQDTERLARVGRRIAAQAGALAADCRDGVGSDWHGLCAAADHAGLEARIAARLRWDRGLEGASVRVQASGGTVELTGTVRDLAQRRRAVELAETTLGADKVNDHLQTAER
ncbi:MAG: BON domain-containing protein [Gemmataceae bacterium]|nr:BON domain-containing protein [Gemmataceae bacterium]